MQSVCCDKDERSEVSSNEARDRDSRTQVVLSNYRDSSHAGFSRTIPACLTRLGADPSFHLAPTLGSAVQQSNPIASQQIEGQESL